MPYIGNSQVAGSNTNNFKVLDDITSYTETFDGTSASIVDTTNNTVNNTTNIMKEKIIELMKQEIEKQKIIQEKNKAPITIANTKGGDVINQSSNTYQSGEPNSDHTETTQKILTTAIA